ncbi:hypothetical protein [Jannaschia pohangensis]|uniref:Secreted protein n=1 Tax=Jannaschia pohangensis TaxID=390807 RepID=A0A1I3Q2U9_9RHOB|nr:hypothetical protein [Jannaschia pohangensis]SFJ27980.1 hypothetical protein SAMN04488095_2393 [Jannaschia pohangensis]
MKTFACLSAAVVVAVAAPTLACSPLLPDTRTSVEIIRGSRPVEVTAQCAFTNGGGSDNLSGGDAVDLGNGRVAQSLLYNNVAVLVSDCQSREATMFYAPVDESKGPFTTCGPTDFLTTLGPDAIVDLSAGATLTELVEIVTPAGLRETDPIRALNTAPWGKPVPRKDRIDLLCGCKLFYPDSPGAR